MPFKPADILSIGELTHWITLCAMKDVVTENGELSLTRKGILSCWAKLEERRGSLHSREGLAIMERKDLRTHRITIRYRTDVDIYNTAWIFEKRMRSPGRWFKVIHVIEKVDRYEIDVRQYDRSETISTPVATTADIEPMPMPDGMKL